MVNQTLARRTLAWRGSRWSPGWYGSVETHPAPWQTVVGVVTDIRHLGPATAPRPELYEVHTQSPVLVHGVRGAHRGDPLSTVGAIRHETAHTSYDPGLPMSGIRTMEENTCRDNAGAPALPVGAHRQLRRAGAVSSPLWGSYGLIGYTVTQRTREIAIRSALGATSRDVLTLVVAKAMWLAAAGVVGGVAASVALSGVLPGLLFGVTAADPVTYAAVVACCTAVACTGRRATGLACHANSRGDRPGGESSQGRSKRRTTFTVTLPSLSTAPAARPTAAARRRDDTTLAATSAKLAAAVGAPALRAGVAGVRSGNSQAAISPCAACDLPDLTPATARSAAPTAGSVR